MKLSEIKENQTARITEISDSLPMKRRLTELGFIYNQKIICNSISIYGSPIAYTICGTRLALRKRDADLIGVKI